MDKYINKIWRADCMDLMKLMPDNYIDLAVVDPPYGIGADKANNSNKGNFGFNKYHDSDWDKNIPDKKYFNELYRTSKNQIIWGGNYFVEYLKPRMCWLVWDKKQDNFSFSDGEIAWSSFNTKLKFFRWSRSATTLKDGGRIHPTQKPVALYRWILQNYAKPGQLIFDSHSGSGSLACACHLEKFDFIATEKDVDYYKDSVKRLDDLRSQGVLF